METKWKSEYDYLKKSILEDKKSYEEIGREYNCSGANIKRAAKVLGIELVNRRRINQSETFGRKEHICPNCGNVFYYHDKHRTKFCSNKCASDYKHRTAYENFIKNPDFYRRANYIPKYFKDFMLAEQGCVCSICGCEPFHNGKPLVFVLDHIDGHASNNNRENLRLVCPNCDSQLDTFKSKNKCGERSYYRYHKNRSALVETQDVELP